MSDGLLLDTHVWLWYAEGRGQRLDAPVVAEIEAARRRRALFVSSISIWEVGMLVGKGRITLNMPMDAWAASAVAPPGPRVLALDAETAVESSQLPGTLHGDSADRFLIAAARVHRLRLVTADRKICRYADDGLVRVLAI